MSCLTPKAAVLFLLLLLQPGLPLYSEEPLQSDLEQESKSRLLSRRIRFEPVREGLDRNVCNDIQSDELEVTLRLPKNTTWSRSADPRKSKTSTLR